MDATGRSCLISGILFLLLLVFYPFIAHSAPSDIQKDGRKTLENLNQIFGDFDGHGQVELVSWNQGARKLLLAHIPSDPKNTQPWPFGTTPKIPDRIAIAHINGDRHPDIIVSEETGLSDASVYWFEQPENPENSPWPRHKVVNQYTTNSMDVADTAWTLQMWTKTGI